MKYSKTALMELSHKYKNVLKRCAILNAAVLMGVALASPAIAKDYTTQQVISGGKVEYNSEDTFKNITTPTSAGGAVQVNSGTLTVNASVFENNISGPEALSNPNYEGGAIRATASTVDIDGATFTNNQSGRGGAISLSNGNTTISNSTFTKNVGGKMASTINLGTFDSTDDVNLTLTGNTFDGNGSEVKSLSVISANGAGTTSDVTITLSGNTFQNNNATAEGVFNIQPGNASNYVETVFQGKNTFQDNAGTGVYQWYQANMTWKDGSETIFTGNDASVKGNTNGGAIYNAGTLTMEDGASATFTENKAVNGGAIYNKGTMTVTDSAFTGNKAISTGGAIRNEGTLTINESDFTGNVVQGKTVYGGALWNSGTLTVSNTDFKGNKALYPDDPSEIKSWRDKRAYSSVLYNSEGTASFTDVNFIGNSGDYMGGAIQNAGGTLNLTRTLFEGNNDRDGKGTTSGASVLLTNAGTMNLADTTFRANLGAGAENTDEGIVNAQGAAIVNFSGTTTFENNKATALGLNAYNNPVVKFVENGTNSFIGNEAKDGAAIKNYNHVSYPEDRGTVLFEAGTENIFSGNKATNNGGAIYNEGIMTFAEGSKAVFQNNTANGVANDIYNTGTLTIGGDLTLDGGIAGTGTVEFTKGSSLKGTLLSSTTPLITADTLKVAEGVTADLTFDIADTEATWTYASAENWDGNFTLSDATQNLNPLFDVKQGADNGTIVVTRKAAEEIVENLTEAGATGNEAATVAAIAQVGTETITDSSAKSVAAAIKQAAQTGDMATVKELTDRVNPAEAPVKHIVSATTAIMGAVANRMSVAAATPAPVVGRSGGDWNDDPTPGPITNLSPWVQGLYNKTHNSQGIGFNAYSRGFAFGADTRLNDAWTVGIGYAYTATDVKNRQRTTNIYGHNYFIYGQYKPNNWYVNAIASLGQADYHDKSVLKSEYDVDSYSGQVMVGYQKGLFDNYAGFRFTQIKTDEYDNGLTVVKAKDTNVGTAIIGTKISKSFTCKNNVTWTPEFRLAGTYDVTSRASSATMNVIGSTASYTVTGDRLSRAALQTGIGLKAKVKDFELVGGYDVELRSQNNTQAVNLKAIYHF